MSECTDMRELRKEWTKFRQYAEGVVSVNVELKQERDGLREQLKGWKKVAQDAEKVRDLALTNQEVAILGRVRAERALDSMRSEAAMRQREHAAILADANEARHKAEQERDGLHLCGESVARMAAELKVERHQANERAANLAVELAAMTLSRDQERQAVATLRRQVEAIAMEYSRAVRCWGCRFRDWCKNASGLKQCSELITDWAAQQAKEAI